MRSFLARSVVPGAPLVMLALALSPGVAHAERIKVAVVPGLAVNVETARVDALGQDLANALATELDVEAIGGLEVRRRLPADGLPADCVTTPSCVTDVATRLDASQLLFVVMVDTGGGTSVQIDSTWIEPASGRTAARPVIDLADLKEARARFGSAARQLLPDAPVRAKPAGGIGGTMSAEVPRHFTRTSLITAGIAVVGLGVSIGFGLRTRSLFDDCDGAAIACTSSEESSIRTSAVIADVGLLAAIGGAIATAVIYASSGSEARLIVGPSVEGTGTGMSVTAFGRF
ncbi:MAG: hypothetical protein M3680_10870 [Myxococcota bacterium]|nr:hypothetical protein [Myxococcota bacterium]